MIRNIASLIVISLLVSCAKVVPTSQIGEGKRQTIEPKRQIIESAKPKIIPKREVVFIPDLKVPRSLSPKQIQNNWKIKQEYKEKLVLLANVAKLDKKEKEELEVKREKIDEQKKELVNMLTEIEKDYEIKDINIKELVLEAKDIKELEIILQEKTELSEAIIAKIIKTKKKLIEDERKFRLEALAKIQNRLFRNRKLEIDMAFCAKSSPLDHFVITPIKYPFDVHSIGKDSANRLSSDIDIIYDELSNYPNLILQVEGNADERGSNTYNKNLGDFRWSGAATLLKAKQFDRKRLRGVSKGEECPIERKTENLEAWWAENRRSDMVWVLSSEKLTREKPKFAKLTLDKGTVKLLRTDISRLYQKKGLIVNVYQNDRIKTGLNTLARIHFVNDKSDIKLFSQTDFTIIKIDKEENLVALDRGKGQFVVKKQKNKRRRFRVRTANAVIGVKGTEFIIGAETLETSVITLQGTVSLANMADPEIEVEVSENTASKVSGPLLPTEPVIVPQELIAKIIEVDSAEVFKTVKYGEPIVLAKDFIRRPSFLVVAGNSEVLLTWDDVPNASSYSLYWSEKPGVNKESGNKISDIKSGFVHENLKNGTSYYYVITANNSSNESAESDEKSVTPRTWIIRFLLEQKKKLEQLLE